VGSSEPYVHELITFDARGSADPDGEITSYEWDFDGDGLFEQVLERPITTYSFARAGEKLVTLRVRDELGAVGVVTKPIEVKEGILTVTRAIATPLPDHEILTGEAFKVTVTILAHGTVMGLGLDEDLPEGWEVEPISNDGAKFKPTCLQWAFFETIHAGETRKITYKVRVPAWEEPGTFKLEGKVIATLPEVEAPVSGDAQVRVIQFLPIKLAISRLDVTTGEIDLTLSNIITFPQIQFAVALWLEDRPVPGTNGKRIDFKTMLELITYWLTDTPVDQPLQR